MFSGRPSTYLWEDAEGTVHTINQGEGGEQGDALMPLLFWLGQHSGLEATHRQLRVNVKLFAYLDDVYIASKPNRAGAVYTSVEENLYGYAHIRIHMGKTHMWNQLGVEPPVCAALQRAAEVVNPHARVWRGSGLPTQEAVWRTILRWPPAQKSQYKSNQPRRNVSRPATSHTVEILSSQHGMSIQCPT